MTSQEPPPSYEQATGSARLSQRERNGISAQRRRSIEDESRPLPEGWVRTFDPENQHQFFVNIRSDPPRSIWHHPYDDEEFLNSLPPEERERLGGLTRHPSKEDIAAESTDDEGDSHHHAPTSSSNASATRSLGRKMKDKITGTTHEERDAERRRRREREQDLYRQHELFRRGLAAAMETGRPQRLGQDDTGTDVYLEPPDSQFPGATHVRQLSPSLEEVFYAPDAPGVPRGVRHVRPVTYSSYRGGGMGGYPGVGSGGFGGGIGGAPYGRPFGPYNRPMGMGYGGGMGMMPMALPLFGGMALGGMLF